MTQAQQIAAATAALLAAYYGEIPEIEAFLAHEATSDHRSEKQPVAQAA